MYLHYYMEVVSRINVYRPVFNMWSVADVYIYCIYIYIYLYTVFIYISEKFAG